MRCPGQDPRYWNEEAIFEVPCPHCGYLVEFFKDDVSRKCPNCHARLVNPKMDFGCALYCQYAELCLGELPKEVLQERAELLKERLTQTIRDYLPAELYQEIRNKARELDEQARAKGTSPGLKLLLLYFYFLPTQAKEEVIQKARIPEQVIQEIELKLKNLPCGLTPEALFNTLNKN